MDRQNEIADELIDLGAATEETRGITPGFLVDDQKLQRSAMGLSND